MNDFRKASLYPFSNNVFSECLLVTALKPEKDGHVKVSIEKDKQLSIIANVVCHPLIIIIII